MSDEIKAKNRLTKLRLDRLSLVDNPAVPSSRHLLMKSVGVVRQAIDESKIIAFVRKHLGGITEERIDDMDIKSLKLEDLEKGNPELYASILAKGKAEAKPEPAAPLDLKPVTDQLADIVKRLKSIEDGQTSVVKSDALKPVTDKLAEIEKKQGEQDTKLDNISKARSSQLRHGGDPANQETEAPEPLMKGVLIKMRTPATAPAAS